MAWFYPLYIYILWYIYPPPLPPYTHIFMVRVYFRNKWRLTFGLFCPSWFWIKDGVSRDQIFLKILLRGVIVSKNSYSMQMRCSTVYLCVIYWPWWYKKFFLYIYIIGSSCTRGNCLLPVCSETFDSLTFLFFNTWRDM